MKHYQLKGEAKPRSPRPLYEVNLELQDVRSGYRNSDCGFFKAEWLEEAELHWTKDMVLRIERGSLLEIKAPSFLSWPELGDQKIIKYLMQNYRPQIWRNSVLGLYSTARENKLEFLQRCEGGLFEERDRELKKVREVFLHRFLEMEQRLFEVAEEEPWDEDWKSRQLMGIQNLVSLLRENLSRWFMQDDPQLPARTQWEWTSGLAPELMERLTDLRAEFIARYNQISGRYEQAASEIESYEVPLSYSQIEIVSRGVLWT